ncbi:hypothetical protein [Haloferax mucosum]|uniref:hypothetical protein n=1 Tax=Haloferax mucosum TaxID=403181 RepID=UPI000321CF81|nr:hypothetical protein [Haloferax mucosum]
MPSEFDANDRHTHAYTRLLRGWISCPECGSTAVRVDPHPPLAVICDDCQHACYDRSEDTEVYERG